MHKFLKFIFGIKLYMFLCPSSGVFHRTYNNGICRTGLVTACEQDQDGLILLASCQQTCITYTIAVCTVKNS